MAKVSNGVETLWAQERYRQRDRRIYDNTGWPKKLQNFLYALTSSNIIITNFFLILTVK